MRSGVLLTCDQAFFLRRNASKYSSARVGGLEKLPTADSCAAILSRASEKRTPDFRLAFCRLQSAGSVLVSKLGESRGHHLFCHAPFTAIRAKKR